jgi:hypothetical protein
MNAEDLINTVSVCLDMSEDEVKDVLLSAAALTSYSRDFAIRHTISELDVNQEQAEILLSWGEKNYDIGPNQSF